MRPASADVASPAVNKVIPVPPVNPTVEPSPALESSPGVVNHVGSAAQMAKSPTEGEPIYTSVPDINKRSAENAPHDWTLHHPEPEKPKDPPPKPMSQMLMEHLKTVWTASASAIQPERSKEELSKTHAVSASAPLPSAAAQEALTYQPSKVKKTENL